MDSEGVTLRQGRSLWNCTCTALKVSDEEKHQRESLLLRSSITHWSVPILAGVFYPYFGLLLSPMITEAAMSFSSVSLAGKALRLRRVRI